MSNDWKYFSYDELFSIQGGTQPPKSVFMHKPQEGYVRLLQIQDFKSDDYAVYVPDNPKLRKCNEDDVLIGRYGASVGRILKGKAGAYNVAIVKTVPNENLISREYLYYLLQGIEFQSFIIDECARAAQAGFNKGDFKKVKSKIPPLPEQKRIATILKEKLAAIEKAKAKTEAQLEAAQTLSSSFLCQTFPQPDQELPNGWQCNNLGNIAKLSQGIQVPIEGQSLQLKEGYVRFLRISDYTDVVEPRYIKNPGQQFVVDSDDLVMIRYGYAGNVVRGHVGAIANNLFLIKPEPSLVSRQYLYWYLRQNHIRKFMLSGNTSSTMPQVAHKIVQKVKVYFPSIYEQKQIAARLDSQLLIIEQATNMIEQTIAEIDILSSAILRAAINGEL